MKLATYNDGSRDGQLIVVSCDLASAHYASGIAQCLRQALDDWNFISPQLQDLYQTLNHGKARQSFPFEPALCMAPLPRTFQWAVPAAAEQVPLTHRASDHFLGPREAIVMPAGAGTGIDFGPALAVATGDVRAGSEGAVAADGVRLLLLACDWFQHGAGADDAPDALSEAPFATAFAPLAVTPDEAGEGWREGRLDASLQISLNDQKFARHGLTDTRMAARFGNLLARLAAVRDVRAGSLVSSGSLAGRDEAFTDIAGKRAAQLERDGQRGAAFMTAGDRVRIDLIGPDSRSLFGAIEQTLNAAI